MSFEPKLVSADDSAEQHERELPPPLRALTVQLRQEASELAARYDGDPRKLPGMPGPSRLNPTRRTLRRPTSWLAAGLVVLLALAVWTPWSQPELPRTPNQPVAPLPRPAVPDLFNLEASHLPPSDPLSANPTISHSETEAGSERLVTPAVFLKDVSGPELEGLLDLLQQRPGRRLRITM